MKMKLKAIVMVGMSALLMTVGAVYAASSEFVKKPPNPNFHMVNMPDCPSGFVKTNVSSPGGANGSHSFTCVSPLIRCPPAPTALSGAGGMSPPQARTMGSGLSERVQFSFGCYYQQIN